MTLLLRSKIVLRNTLIEIEAIITVSALKLNSKKLMAIRVGKAIDRNDKG